MYQVSKTWEILLLLLKIPVILHSIEFEILACTMLKIAFPGLRRSYLITPLIKYCCQYEHPSKNLSYGPDFYLDIFHIQETHSALHILDHLQN